MLGADLSLEGRADVLGEDLVCDAAFLCEETAKKKKETSQSEYATLPCCRV